MREDMGKVITERPRNNSRDRSRQKGIRKRDSKLPLEDHPKRAPLREKGGKNKQFTDVLGPLRGFVFRQIGRPFSKVFAEISKVLRPTGLSGSHAQDHLWDMLVTKVVIRDGKPYHSDARGGYRKDSEGYRPIEYEGSFSDVAYVDPRDGIVKRAPKGLTFNQRFKQQVEIKPKGIWLNENDNKYYRKLFDCWFEITVKPLIDSPQNNKYYLNYDNSDVVLDYLAKKENVKYTIFPIIRSNWELTNFHGKPVRAIAKRQLSSNEIKNLGLNKMDVTKQEPLVIGGKK